MIGRSVNPLFSASLLYFSHIPKTTIVHVPLLPHYGHTFINMVINCNNIFLQTDIKVASPIFQVFSLPPEVMSPGNTPPESWGNKCIFHSTTSRILGQDISSLFLLIFSWKLGSKFQNCLVFNVLGSTP